MLNCGTVVALLICTHIIHAWSQTRRLLPDRGLRKNAEAETCCRCSVQTRSQVRKIAFQLLGPFCALCRARSCPVGSSIATSYQHDRHTYLVTWRPAPSIVRDQHSTSGCTHIRGRSPASDTACQGFDEIEQSSARGPTAGSPRARAAPQLWPPPTASCTGAPARRPAGASRSRWPRRSCPTSPSSCNSPRVRDTAVTVTHVAPDGVIRTDPRRMPDCCRSPWHSRRCTEVCPHTDHNGQAALRSVSLALQTTGFHSAARGKMLLIVCIVRATQSPGYH